MQPILDDNLEARKSDIQRELLQRRAFVYLLVMLLSSVGVALFVHRNGLHPFSILYDLARFLLPPLVLGYVLEGIRRLIQLMRHRKPPLPLWYEGWERAFSWWIVLMVIRALLVFGPRWAG